MRCTNRKHSIIGEFYLDDIGNIIQVIPKDSTKKIKEYDGYNIYCKTMQENETRLFLEKLKIILV